MTGFQRINILFIDPVVNHHCSWHMLSFEPVSYSFHKIPPDGDNKIALPAAEFVQKQHKVKQYSVSAVTYCTDLFRIEILNVIDKSGMLYPLTPYAKQTAQNGRLGKSQHIIHGSCFPCSRHGTEEIGEDIPDPAVFICLHKFRHTDPKHCYSVQMFPVIFFLFITFIYVSQITWNRTDHSNFKLIQQTFRQFTENLTCRCGIGDIVMGINQQSFPAAVFTHCMYPFPQICEIVFLPVRIKRTWVCPKS